MNERTVDQLIHSPWFVRIHHVGIAVPNLTDAIAQYQTLFGTPVQRIEVVDDQKVKTAFFSVGESHFELLEATEESSPIAKYLLKYRPGIHHICVEVNDIDSVIESYLQAGIQMIDKVARPGAHNMKVAFVHPKSTNGVLLEIAETTAH